MHPLNFWRMLPPGAAPVSPAGILRGLAARRESEAALDALRRDCIRLLGTPHIFFAGSGRSALARLFAALRRKNPGRDQVLLPAYASYSLPAAVVRANCRVALYDLEPRGLAPDTASLRRALGEKTLAVVAVHQFGYPFDLAPLAPLCREAGAALVDDAAQALGAETNGRLAGTMGDAGLFSLGRAKPLTAVDGGILAVRDEKLAADLRSFFSPDAAGWDTRPDCLLPLKAMALCLLRRPGLYRLPASLRFLGLGASIFDPDFADAPLTAFQAGMAAFALRGLHAANRARADKAAAYQQGLEGARWRGLVPQRGARPIHLRFPVLPRDDNGPWPDPASPACRRLGISRGFPLSLADLPALRPHLAGGPDSGGFSGARMLARRLLTLPTHDLVREADCRAVCALLRGGARAGNPVRITGEQEGRP